MRLRSSVCETQDPSVWAPIRPYRMGSGYGPKDDSAQPTDFTRAAAGGGDLPYRVELWDDERKAVEQVLAVTAHGSIGYAAYYAAIKEFPDRVITLRHRNRTITSSQSS
jgi:hypothetical protein